MIAALRHLLLLALAGLPPALGAHAFAPSRLAVEEQADGLVRLEWRTPARVVPGGVAPTPLLPAVCVPEGHPATERLASSYRSRWTLRCPAPGLVGQTLGADGLVGGLGQVLLSVRLADGRRVDALLDAERPQLQLEPAAGEAQIARDYFVLGVEHILLGWDHLVFVAVLVLLCLPVAAAPLARASTLALLRTVTAFTLGQHTRFRVGLATASGVLAAYWFWQRLLV